MIMYVSLVYVGRDHDLNVVAKSFTNKRTAHTVGKLRGYIVIGRKGLDIVKQLHVPFSFFRLSFLKLVVGEVLVYEFHVKICVLRIRKAVVGVAIKQPVRFLRIKDILQALPHSCVDSFAFNVRHRRSVSPFIFS